MQAPALLPALSIGAVTVPGNNLVVAAVGGLLFLLILFILNYTRYGRQMRFASDDPALAAHAGINVDHVFELSFVVGGFAAGGGGGVGGRRLCWGPPLRRHPRVCRFRPLGRRGAG